MIFHDNNQGLFSSITLCLYSLRFFNWPFLLNCLNPPRHHLIHTNLTNRIRTSEGQYASGSDKKAKMLFFIQLSFKKNQRVLKQIENTTCSCHQTKVLRVFESTGSVILIQGPAGLHFGTSASSDFSGLDWPTAALAWVPLNACGSGKEVMGVAGGARRVPCTLKRLPKESLLWQYPQGRWHTNFKPSRFQSRFCHELPVLSA